MSVSRIAERSECGGHVIKPPESPQNARKGQLSARKALEIWAFWTSSGRFRTAGSVSSNGNSEGFDEGLVVSVHCERFFNSHIHYRRIMLHSFAHSTGPEDFVWIRPGKSMFTCAALEGWLNWAGLKQADIPRAVYNAGMGEFRRWFDAHPVPGMTPKLLDHFEPIVRESEKNEKSPCNS